MRIEKKFTTLEMLNSDVICKLLLSLRIYKACTKTDLICVAANLLNKAICCCFTFNYFVKAVFVIFAVLCRIFLDSQKVGGLDRIFGNKNPRRSGGVYGLVVVVVSPHTKYSDLFKLVIDFID